MNTANAAPNSAHKNYHSESIEKIISIFNTTESGLSTKDAQERLLEQGKNKVEYGKDESILVTFFRQFLSPLIYVLLGAAVVVIFLGELTDSLIIIFVLIVNALVGAFQEGKARKTFNALRDFSKGSAFVLRDGLEIELSDEDIVRGDVLVLRSGDKVPADARVISTQGLKVDESALTGESEPVEKVSNPLSLEMPPSDRKNMLYKGSLVVSGSAQSLVVETGSNTMLGSISERITQIESEMPLKKKIADLSKIIGIAVLAAAILVFLVGILKGVEIREIFFASVAIAVSLIPEGLPVVITLILAIGVFSMAKRNALIKNMQAIEALGQATVIAVDKTGTITKNELMIQKVWTYGKEYEITGSGFDPKGEVFFEGKIVEPLNHSDLLFAGKVGVFCTNASIRYEEGGVVKVSGDPTEAAMLVFGEKVGFNQAELLSESPQVFEVPFSYEHKFHTMMHKQAGGYLLTIVGEPESLLRKVQNILIAGGERLITDEDRKIILEKIHALSREGLRVILYAFSQVSDPSVNMSSLPPLSFGGVYAMSDVLRPQVEEAVYAALQYGVRTVMITGDHLGTAEAIAKKAGIWKEGDLTLSGTDLQKMNEKELSDVLPRVRVFGRVLPEHKMTIVEAYKNAGEIIGMTGDGVNDALSLRAAHLGIAMGQGGTEVAKEAADIVLLDNNFKSIIAAIEEGRRIYATIKNVVLYLISTGVGEFLTILGSLVLGWNLPILPSQILWLNLVTDGFLVVALAFESKVKSGSVPRRSSSVFNQNHALRAIFMGSIMMLGTLLVYKYFPAESVALRSTIALTLLAVFQWFNAWNCRSDNESAFKKPFSNPYLLLGLLGAVISHIFAIYNPFMQNILKTAPISLETWSYVVLVASALLWLEEIRKLFIRKK